MTRPAARFRRLIGAGGRTRRFAARLALLAAIIYVGCYHVAPAVIGENGQLSLSLPSVGALISGTALFLCINVCAACSWGEIVDPDRSRLTSRARVCRVWMLSNIGKYLPGNVLHFAGRYALGRQEGLGRAESVTGLMLEVILVVSIGSLLSLPGLSTLFATHAFADFVPVDFGLHPLGIGLTVAMIVVISVGVSNSVRRGLRTRVTDILEHLRRRRAGRAVLKASLLQLACFLLAGAAAVVLLGSLAPGSASYATLTSAYALAFLAGFILIGAPGGIGVRELTLVALLSTETGVTAALGLAIGLRLCSILADAIGAALVATMEDGADSSTAC